MTIARTAVALIAFGISGFGTHVLVYAIPKGIEFQTGMLPGGFEYYDQTNLVVSYFASGLVGLLCATSAFRRRGAIGREIWQ